MLTFLTGKMIMGGGGIAAAMLISGGSYLSGASRPATPAPAPAVQVIQVPVYHDRTVIIQRTVTVKPQVIIVSGHSAAPQPNPAPAPAVTVTVPVPEQDTISPSPPCTLPPGLCKEHDSRPGLMDSGRGSEDRVRVRQHHGNHLSAGLDSRLQPP